MKTGEFVAAFLDEFDVLVANWQKRKKGFNHHDGKRLVREAMVNVFVRHANGKSQPIKPSDED